MKKKNKHILVLVVLILIICLSPSCAKSTSESSMPMGNISSAQIAKSVNHNQVLTELQTGNAVRLLIKVPVPGYTNLGDMKGTEEAEAKAEIDAAQADFARSSKDEIVEDMVEFVYIPYVSVWVDSIDEYRNVLTNPNIISVQQDVPVPASTFYADWNASASNLAGVISWIDAEKAHDLGYDGDGWTIAILDTGVDKDHAFLNDNKVVSEACYSTTDATFGSSTLCPGGTESSIEVNSAEPYISGICENYGCDHGTHVAGIAAGNDSSFSGIAPNANLIAIQIFSMFNSPQYCGADDPTCVMTWTTDQILGLERVYELRNTYNIAAVNMSLGGGKYGSFCNSDSRSAIISTLKAAGIATIVATGNNSFVNGVSAPACIADAIAVGATNYNNDLVTSFSNAAANLVDIWAPGENITSSVPTEMYGAGAPTEAWDGTSMSTPIVAGAWAVLKEAFPSYTVDEIAYLIDIYGVSVTDQRTNGTAEAPRIDFTYIFDSLNSPIHIYGPVTGYSTSDHTPNFGWDDVAGAQKYNIQISPTPDFSILPINHLVTPSWFAPGVAMINQTYWWRARVQVNDAWSPWSEIRTITIFGAPGQPAPEALLPADGSKTTNHRPTFDWTDIPTAARYRIHISTNPDFKVLLVNQLIDNSEFTPGIDINSGTYYWRVQAMGGGDVSWFTVTRVLTIE